MIKTEDPASHSYLRKLDGLEELIAYAEHIDTQSARLKRKYHSDDADKNGWQGSRNLRHAIELARYGWPEGRQRFAELAGKIALDDVILSLGVSQEYLYDVAGDEPDIDRYLSGDPENMQNLSISPATSGKVMHLVVNCAQHANIAAQYIERRGVAIMAAIDALSIGGYAVGLTMVRRMSGYNNYDSTLEQHIPIYQPGQYLNQDTLAFCLMHPSFLRRMIFALDENESNQIRREFEIKRGGRYGRPILITYDNLDKNKTLIIDKDDGLLDSDEEITPYATGLAKELLAKSSAESLG